MRARVGDLAQDVVDACLSLMEAHIDARRAQNHSTALVSKTTSPSVPPDDVLQSKSPEEFFRWARSQPVPTVEEMKRNAELLQRSHDVTARPYAQARLAYKHVLFVVRALQDAIYAAYLEATGKVAGKYSSIKTGLQDGKPLALLVADRCPGYGVWFLRWRDMRNRVKDGVNFGITGIRDLGMMFSHVDENGGLIGGDPLAAFSIPDVVDAVEASSGLMATVASVSGRNADVIQ